MLRSFIGFFTLSITNYVCFVDFIKIKMPFVTNICVFFSTQEGNKKHCSWNGESWDFQKVKGHSFYLGITGNIMGTNNNMFAWGLGYHSGLIAFLLILGFYNTVLGNTL